MKNLLLLTLFGFFGLQAQAESDYIQLERNKAEVLGEMEIQGLFSFVEEYSQKTCLLESFDEVKVKGIPYEKCIQRGPRPSPFTPGKCLQYELRPAATASYRRIVLPQRLCDLRSIARYEGEIVTAIGTLVFSNEVYRTDRRLFNDVVYADPLFYHFRMNLGDDTQLEVLEP